MTPKPVHVHAHARTIQVPRGMVDYTPAKVKVPDTPTWVWGFKYPDFSTTERAQALFNEFNLGLKEEFRNENGSLDRVLWSNPDGTLELVTEHNPLTAEFSGDKTRHEPGFFGYAGVRGSTSLVAALGNAIQKKADYVKGSTPGDNAYIGSFPRRRSTDHG